jgi:hypothetical protein
VHWTFEERVYGGELDLPADDMDGHGQTTFNGK